MWKETVPNMASAVSVPVLNLCLLWPLPNRCSIQVQSDLHKLQKELLCICLYTDHCQSTDTSCVASIAINAKLLLIVLSQKKNTTRHEGALGEGTYSSYSFTTSALDGGEWSASRPGHALPPGKGPPVPIVQEAGWAPVVRHYTA
jgi:hypothetical protein